MTSLSTRSHVSFMSVCGKYPAHSDVFTIVNVCFDLDFPQIDGYSGETGQFLLSFAEKLFVTCPFPMPKLDL